MEGIQNNKLPNSLLLYRKRMGFSQKHVARLLGKPVSVLSRYENGKAVPPLLVALGLGIIYRIPVETLYWDLYRPMRESIRTEEEKLRTPTQAVLF